MSLQGDLRSISLADVMQMIGSNQSSGILYVASEEAARVLTFRHGMVTTGSSLEQRFLLGKVLCQRGIIDPLQLAEALEKKKVKNLPLGETLLEMGLLQADDLTEVIQDQVQSVMNDVFRWTDGGFLFADDDPDASFHGAGSGFAVQAMLMESLRASDEWERVATQFEDRDAVPKFEDGGQGGNLPQGSDDALALLELVDGFRNVRSLIQKTRWSEHRALMALSALFEAGLVAMRTGATSRSTIPDFRSAYSSHVPVMPRSGARAVAMAVNENPGSLELRELALSDPGLCVSVLRAAGALSTEDTKVTTVTQAVEALGPNLTRRALVGGGLRGLYAKQKPWTDMWRHSLATSIAARLIARQVAERAQEVEVARLIGLCHDIGSFLLNHTMPAQYEQVLAIARSGQRLIDAERKVLGVGHDSVAAHAFDTWGVHPSIAEAILHHHARTRNVPTMAAIAGLADLIAKRAGFTVTGRKSKDDEGRAQRQGILRLSDVELKAIERNFAQICAAKEPLW